MLTINSSTFFCGWYGYSFWPIWSFRVADLVVADMVCGRYGCGQYILWPIWYITSRFTPSHLADYQWPGSMTSFLTSWPQSTGKYLTDRHMETTHPNIPAHCPNDFTSMANPTKGDKKYDLRDLQKAYSALSAIYENERTPIPAKTPVYAPTTPAML